MSTAILLPSFTPPAEVVSRVAEQGYAILSPEAVSCLSGCSPSMLAALAPSWNDLPLDAYLKDGGRYRRRRHSCFVFEHNRLQQAPHRAHWQPVDYNALHGGMQRWFEPVTSATLAQPAWSLLLSTIATTCSQLRGDAGKPAAWYIEAHQFRIDTVDGSNAVIAGVTQRDLSDDIFVEYTRILTPNAFLTLGGSMSKPAAGIRALMPGSPPVWSGAFANVVMRW